MLDLSSRHPDSADTIALHLGQASGDSTTGATSGSNERFATASPA